MEIFLEKIENEDFRKYFTACYIQITVYMNIFAQLEFIFVRLNFISVLTKVYFCVDSFLFYLLLP